MPEEDEKNHPKSCQMMDNLKPLEIVYWKLLLELSYSFQFDEMGCFSF